MLMSLAEQVYLKDGKLSGDGLGRTHTVRTIPFFSCKREGGNTERG